MLVEVIVKSFITDYLFDSKDGLKEILQEKLDLNLMFDTKVSEIETKNEHAFGKISFEDENGLIKVIDFTITDVSDSKFEMIGPDMDEILDGINFINQNYDGSVKLKPMDWSLLVSDNYSIFVKFEPEGDENKHIRFMNDMLSENNFDCKLYKTK